MRLPLGKTGTPLSYAYSVVQIPACGSGADAAPASAAQDGGPPFPLPFPFLAPLWLADDAGAAAAAARDQVGAACPAATALRGLSDDGSRAAPFPLPLAVATALGVECVAAVAAAAASLLAGLGLVSWTKDRGCGCEDTTELRLLRVERWGEAEAGAEAEDGERRRVAGPSSASWAPGSSAPGSSSTRPSLGLSEMRAERLGDCRDRWGTRRPGGGEPKRRALIVVDCWKTRLLPAWRRRSCRLCGLRGRGLGCGVRYAGQVVCDRLESGAGGWATVDIER